MAIPGADALDDIAGKVRVGEQRGGRAASTDYFLCDHSAFDKFAGSKPKAIRVKFTTDDRDEAWSTGLEWWMKTRKGQNLLACYTKDSGSNPVALRYEPMLDPDDKVLGEKRGHERLPITCRFRDCPHFKSRDCRPMGRLTFALADDPDGLLWRFETKGWGSIEAISKAMGRVKGPLVGKTFELSVAFESKGNKRFPVVSLTEVEVQINSDKDITEADALIALTKVKENGGDLRQALAAYLDATRPGWKQDERYTARIREVGVEKAVESLLERARD